MHLLAYESRIYYIESNFQNVLSMSSSKIFWSTRIASKKNKKLGALKICPVGHKVCESY